MLRKTITLFVLSLIACTCFSQSKPLSIKEIATKFYNTYEVYGLEYPSVNFEKRKNTWKVTTKKMVNNNLVVDKSFSFYDGTTGKFNKLPLSLKTNNDKVDYKNYVDAYQEKNYTLHKYYGYAGWYKDVIADYSSKKILTDSALYSLARAYSMYANCLLLNQSGEAVVSEIFKMPIAKNCITKEQLKLYDSIMKQSIQSFSKLAKQNKKFETTVGNITLKYANESMVQFHTYLTYASEQQVNNYVMPNHLYPDSVITKTKAILEKCPANAIFLSWGDNDFYPILYVQHHLGFRKDVYLINQSLLGLDRFVFTATNSQFNSTPIKIAATSTDYLGRNNDYLVLTKNDSTITFNEVIDFLKTGERNEMDVLTLPSNSFSINHVGEGTATNNIALKIRGSYLLKSDWVLLDILNNLNGRKLCTTYPFYDSFEGLNDYFTTKDDSFFVY